MLISDDSINSQKQLDSVDIMARKAGLKIKRAKTEFMIVENWASPSHRITRFYWYNKSSQRLQIFRILAAKLHEKFRDQKGISLEGLYSIGQDLEEQLYLYCCQDEVI
jgi:hypothetical protein